MKKLYQKPSMQVYDITPSKILCSSGDPDSPDYWGLVPGLTPDSGNHLA